MSIAALEQTRAELRRLAVAGAALAPGDPRLGRWVAPLKKTGEKAKVFARLGAELEALAEAAEPEAAGRLLRLSSLGRAVLSTQTQPAPAEAPTPLVSVAGYRSGRHSTRLLATLRQALSATGPGREAQLRMSPAALHDLRLVHLLPAALDDHTIADVVEEALRALIQEAAGDTVTEGGPAAGSTGRATPPIGLTGASAGGDPSLLDSLEAGLHGRPAGDIRRLRLIGQADPSRGQALAWRLLEEKPKPALRAQLYTQLADDPDALDLLVAGAKKGPVEARAAAIAALGTRSGPEALAALLDLAEDSSKQSEAFGALALRPEPEATAAIAAQLGRPGREPGANVPASLMRLWGVFPHITDPALLQRLRDGVLDHRLPVEDSGERWSRENWAQALSLCPVDAANIAALCVACEEGWAPAESIGLVGIHAPLDWLRRLAPLSARARMTAADRRPAALVQIRYQGYAKEVLVLNAALRLPPGELLDLLGDDLARDAALVAAMRVWRQHRDFSWSHLGVDTPWSAVRWDPGWVRRAIAEVERFDGDLAHPTAQRQLRRWVSVVAALVEPGEHTAAAIQVCQRGLEIEFRRAKPLPGSDEGTQELLHCLKRLDAPTLDDAVMEAVRVHRKRTTRNHFDADLHGVLAFTGPAQIPALEALVAKGGPARGYLEQRLTELYEARAAEQKSP